MRRHRLEHNSYFLLRELVTRLSQPEIAVVYLFAGTISAVVAHFTIPRHCVFVKCRPDPECFRQAKGLWLRQFSKATLGTSLDVRLCREKNEAAEAVAGFVPEVAAADPLWSPSDGLLLYW